MGAPPENVRSNAGVMGAVEEDAEEAPKRHDPNAREAEGKEEADVAKAKGTPIHFFDPNDKGEENGPEGAEAVPDSFPDNFDSDAGAVDGAGGPKAAVEGTPNSGDPNTGKVKGAEAEAECVSDNFVSDASGAVEGAEEAKAEALSMYGFGKTRSASHR